MHLLDVSRGVLGAYAIVGAQLVIANGAAWSAQYRGNGQVTVCFLGDGTTNIGAFHEALNLAAVWGLPVAFICENNQYMEYTPIASVTAVPRPAADRAPAYGLEPVVVDGNDVEAEPLLRAGGDHGGARGRRPGTHRGAHLPARRSFPRRPRQVPPRRRGRAVAGPRSAARLPQGAAERGIAGQDLDAIDERARAAVDLATEEAKAGPVPRPGLAETNVWLTVAAAGGTDR